MYGMCLKYTWGQIEVVCTKDAVRRVALVETSSLCDRLPTLCPPLLRQVTGLLARYFRGEAIDFLKIPLFLKQGSAFQGRVWQTIRQIPRGETRTYKWIAARIEQPQAVRAVGNATGTNPIAILIPCHRVIRSDGKLGDYSGGGINRKRQLLTLETAI